MMRAAPTVPGGDTLCVTAGDVRRANPWRNGEGEKRETSQPAPTVPGGDTPCLTAGDARRVNPWRERLPQPPTPEVSHNIHFYSHISLLSQRFQCDAAGVGVLSIHTSTGSPSPQLGHHPRFSMVRLHRRREVRCEDATDAEEKR